MNHSPATESFVASENSPEPSFENIMLDQQVGLPQPAEEIDLEAIALPLNFSDLAAVKTDVAVKIQKPPKQTWFSPHADQKSWKQFATIEDQNDFKAMYVLSPATTADLEKSEWARRILVPCITRQGAIFLWPVRVPDDDGKLDSWSRSALEIVTTAGDEWIRISANHEAQGYVTSKPVTPLPAPVWPDDISGIIKKAIVQRLISSKNHPLLKHLRGEIE